MAQLLVSVFILNVWLCFVRPNIKNIFVYSYLTLFYRYGLVGRKFFLTSQIRYPLNLILYSKTCLKRPLQKKTKKIAA